LPSDCWLDRTSNQEMSPWALWNCHDFLATINQEKRRTSLKRCSPCNSITMVFLQCNWNRSSLWWPVISCIPLCHRASPSPRYEFQRSVRKTNLNLLFWPNYWSNWLHLRPQCAVIFWVCKKRWSEKERGRWFDSLMRINQLPVKHHWSKRDHTDTTLLQHWIKMNGFHYLLRLKMISI